MKPTEINKAEMIIEDYRGLIQLFSDICHISGYSSEELKSSSRRREYVDVRSSFAYIAHERFKSILDKHIAEVINRDRTSVLAMIKSVNNVREKMHITNFYKDELLKL